MCGHSSANLMCPTAVFTMKGGSRSLPPQTARANSASLISYTSLGSTYNTHRNPALLIAPSCITTVSPTSERVQSASDPDPTSHTITSSLPASSPAAADSQSDPFADPVSPIPLPGPAVVEERYRPAYELVDGDLERAGRVKAGSLIPPTQAGK